MTPDIFSHETSEMLNPLPLPVNFDIEYKWNDSEVPTPLYRLGKLLRTDSRRKTDNLLNLENTYGSRSST